MAEVISKSLGVPDGNLGSFDSCLLALPCWSLSRVLLANRGGRSGSRQEGGSRGVALPTAHPCVCCAKSMCSVWLALPCRPPQYPPPLHRPAGSSLGFPPAEGKAPNLVRACSALTSFFSDCSRIPSPFPQLRLSKPLGPPALVLNGPGPRNSSCPPDVDAATASTAFHPRSCRAWPGPSSKVTENILQSSLSLPSPWALAGDGVPAQTAGKGPWGGRHPTL